MSDQQKESSSSQSTKQLFDLKKSKYFSLKAGDLCLQVNRREDVFHAEDVPLFETMPVYEDLIGIEKNGFAFGSFANNGTKIEMLTVDLSPKDTIISGYYSDTLLKEITTPYKVNIYITYEVEE